MIKGIIGNSPWRTLSSSISRKLPVPVNISNMWNFGRCLGLFLLVQILTGLLLSSHYTADVNHAFDSIISLSRNVSWGGLLRVIHLNGASVYFLLIYIHIGRGLYYRSYSYTKSWARGLIILSLSMIVAFLGYVLPWGQISFWGATVITNLVSAIPVVGDQIVQWIWGGFGVRNATLSRFFIIHFCVPFLLIGLVVVHIFLLHKRGRQNPSNLLSNYNILRFNPYFVIKDLFFFFGLFLIFELLVFFRPYLLGDPENFSAANMLSTPEHIVPEWYFLYAYAILRCVPSKGLGVTAILISILILLFPIITGPVVTKNIRKSKSHSVTMQKTFWFFLRVVILLTWLGGQTVSSPFVGLRQILFGIYLFFIFFLLSH